MAQQQRYARALYDFAGDGPNLLTLREGDLVLVTEERDDGWWGGVLDGRAGFFPANYVQIEDNQQNQQQGFQGVNQQYNNNNTTSPRGRGSEFAAAGAGAAAGAAGGYALGRHRNQQPTIRGGGELYTGKDEYIIEEEKWYLREKRRRPLFCGLVLSKWQYRLFIFNVLGLLNIALILLTILVITPAILNALVAGSTLRFDALTITNPDSTNNAFIMRASASLFNAGPFNANIDPVSLTLFLISPYAQFANELEVGKATLASVHISGTTHFTQTVYFQITNVTNLAIFNHVLINQEFVKVHVSARPTVTPTIWNVDWELPFHYHNTPLDKTLNLKAFNGLTQVAVTKFDLSSSTGSQIIANVGVDVFNPSIFTINPLGVLSVDLYYLGAKLGTAHTNEPAVATLGLFHLDLTGVITATNTTALDALIQRYLTGQSTVVTAISTPGAESSIGLFAPGLAGFALNTLTPGFIQSLVSSLSFNSLSILPDDASENILFSADLTLVANSPAGPNGFFQISALTLQAEIVGAGGDIIGILTTTETAYPTPIFPEGKNITNTFNVRVNNALLDVTGHETSYLNFVYNFSQVENITLSNVGKSNVVITVVLGALPIQGLSIVANATTPGLQGLPTTKVTTIGVAGVAPCIQSGGGQLDMYGNRLCGIEATTTATVTNPSITTINITEANLGFYFECVRLGTLSAQPLYLQPGFNTLSLAGFILPPEKDLQIAGVFFSNFLNGLPSTATIRGDVIPGYPTPLPDLPGCTIVTSLGDGTATKSLCCVCGECPQSWSEEQKVLHDWKRTRAEMHHNNTLFARDQKMLCPTCTDSSVSVTTTPTYAATSTPTCDTCAEQATATPGPVYSAYQPPVNTINPNFVQTPGLDALHLTTSALTVTTTILFPPQKLLLGASILNFGLIFDPACRAGYCPISAATTADVLLGLPPGISFPLQALSTSAVLNVYFNGREAVTLNVPQTPVTQFHTQGVSIPPTYAIPDKIQLTVTNNPIVVDSFDSFSDLTAQLLNTYSGTIHIESLTNPIASTDAGQLPLYSIPLVTDTTILGFNSFKDINGVSTISINTLDILGATPNYISITSSLTIYNPSNVFLVNGQTITFDLWYTSLLGRGQQRVGNLSVPNFAISNPSVETRNDYVGFGFFDPPAIQLIGAEFLGNVINRIASPIDVTGATCNLFHQNGASGCNSVSLVNAPKSPLYGTGTTIPLLVQGVHEFTTRVVAPGLDHSLVIAFYLDLGALLGSLTGLLNNPTLLVSVLALLLQQQLATTPFAGLLEHEKHMQLQHAVTANSADVFYHDETNGHLVGAGFNLSALYQDKLASLEYHRQRYESADGMYQEINDIHADKKLLLQLAQITNELESNPETSTHFRKLLQVGGFTGASTITDLGNVIVGLIAILAEGNINPSNQLNNPPLSIPTQITINNSFSVPLQLVAGNLIVYAGTPSATNPPIATYIHNIDLVNSQCAQPIVPAHAIFTVPCVYVNALLGTNTQGTLNVLAGTAFSTSYISAVGTLTARVGGPGGFVYTIPAQAINVPSKNAVCPSGSGLNCGCGQGVNTCGTDYSNPNAGNKA